MGFKFLLGYIFTCVGSLKGLDGLSLLDWGRALILFCWTATAWPENTGYFPDNNKSESKVGSKQMLLGKLGFDAVINGDTRDEYCLYIQSPSYEKWFRCYLVMLQFGRSAGESAVKLIEADQENSELKQ